MLVHVYANTQCYAESYSPLVVEDVKYISSAVGNTGWVLVKEDGGEIILPLGVVIEKFESDIGETNGK